MRRGDRFELAIELSIPAERRSRIKNGGAETCRYEVAIDVSGPLRIVGETLWLKPLETEPPASQRTLFPDYLFALFFCLTTAGRIREPQLFLAV